MRKPRRVIAAFAAAAVAISTAAFVGTSPSTGQADPPPQAQTTPAVPVPVGKIDATTKAKVDRGEKVQLLLLVKDGTAQDVLDRALRGKADRAVRDRVATSYAVTVEAPPGLARQLIDDPDVLAVNEDQQMQPLLDGSKAEVGASTATIGAWAQGYDGTGTVVAVLDTGIDNAHAAFSGAIFDEGCVSATSDCPGNVSTITTGAGAAAHEHSSYDGWDHGSWVAGIVASQNATYKGIAFGADVFAINVFDSYCNGVAQDQGVACVGGTTHYVSSSTSSQVTALDMVKNRKVAGANIVAANMSLGTATQWTVPCDSNFSAVSTAVANLYANGVSTTWPGGNDGHITTTTATYPSCLNQGITAGGYDPTNIETAEGCSNGNPFIDSWAPMVTTSVKAAGTYVTSGGTSGSAPYLAAAIAILKDAQSGATTQQVEDAIATSGKPFIDARTGAWTLDCNGPTANDSFGNGYGGLKRRLDVSAKVANGYGTWDGALTRLATVMAGAGSKFYEAGFYNNPGAVNAFDTTGFSVDGSWPGGPGQNSPHAAMTAGETRTFDPMTNLAVPASLAESLVMRIRVIGQGAGNIQVWDAVNGTAVVPQVTFQANTDQVNLIVVPVSSTGDQFDGMISLKNNSSSTADVFASIVGWFGRSADVTPLATPVQVINGSANGALGSVTSANLISTGVAPAGTAAAFVQMTVTSASAATALAILPDNKSYNGGSNMRVAASETLTKMALVPLGTSNGVKVVNAGSGNVNVTVHVVAWVPASSTSIVALDMANTGYGGAGSRLLLNTSTPSGDCYTYPTGGTVYTCGTWGAYNNAYIQASGKAGIPAAGSVKMVFANYEAPAYGAGGASWIEAFNGGGSSFIDATVVATQVGTQYESGPGVSQTTTDGRIKVQNGAGYGVYMQIYAMGYAVP